MNTWDRRGHALLNTRGAKTSGLRVNPDGMRPIASRSRGGVSPSVAQSRQRHDRALLVAAAVAEMLGHGTVGVAEGMRVAHAQEHSVVRVRHVDDGGADVLADAVDRQDRPMLDARGSERVHRVAEVVGHVNDRR